MSEINEKIKNFLKAEYKPLLIITVFFVFCALIYQYKMINLFIDFSREAMTPKAVLEGEVLYKDIFNLYAPLSYLFNAFILKFAGVNLRTYNFIGLINTYLILNGVYFISRNFLSKSICCLLTLLVMFVCAFVPFVTNYITPYSYAVVFGLCAIIFTILSVFKYLESGKVYFLYTAYLLCGIAFANKFDYIFCLIPLIMVSFYMKSSLKAIILSLALWASPTIFSYVILVLQGLRLNDYITYLDIMHRYLKLPSLHYFYSGTMLFSSRALTAEIIRFFISSYLFFMTYRLVFTVRNKNAVFTYLIQALMILILYKAEQFSTLGFFCYFPLLLIISSLIKINEIKTDKKVLFLILMSIAVCAKSLNLLYLAQYGRYFLPLLAVSNVIILRNYYFKKNKEFFDKTITILLIGLIISNFFIYFKEVKNYNYKIQTSYGTVYTNLQYKQIYDYIITYVLKNTDKKDRIVVLPESSIINFLTDRKTDNYYNHFEKISFEAYGEDKIISHYRSNSPDYFIIFTSQQEHTAFCKGYANKTCTWINDNYQVVSVINSEPFVLIFKKI